MRTLILALLIGTSAFHGTGKAQESKTHKENKPSLHLAIATEDNQPAKIKLELKLAEANSKFVKEFDDVVTGSTDLPLAGLFDANYYLFFSAPGYASQWRTMAVRRGKGEPDRFDIKLFRKKYVVLRYAFNTAGSRNLTGKDMEEGHVAVAHWGGLPYFQHDWQIWQKTSEDETFGDTPYLDFHRFNKDFGFAKVPQGTDFEDLKKAPSNSEYQCRNVKAEKGLTLFCRVQGNNKKGLGYGKVVIEDVTNTPPPGVKVIDPRR